MADIDNVISSLDDLNKKAIATPLAFKGLTKSLVSMANSTSDAGKSWTTFSRLVSGTPIWKYQNKFRGFLEVLGGFEKRSKDNMKAMSEESEKLVESLKGFEATTKSINKLNDARISHIKRLEKEKEIKEENTKIDNNSIKIVRLESKGILNLSAKKRKLLSDLKQENTQRLQGTIILKQEADALKKKASLSEDMKKTIKNSEIYHKVLTATGSEEKARLATTLFLNKKYKQQEKSLNKVKNDIKIAYAFDKKRVKEAKEIAKMQGLSRREQRKAGRQEKKTQTKEQRAVKKQSFKDANVSLIKGIGGDFKEIGKFGKFLLPIPMLFKLMKGAMFFTKEGRSFRTKIYSIIPKVMTVLNAVFKYIILGMMAILGFFILLKYIQKVYDILQEFGIIDEIKSAFSILYEAVSNIFKAFSSFMSGDYKKAFDYLNKGLDKLLQGAIKLGKALLKAGFLALVAGFEMVVDAVYSYFTNPDVQEKVNGIILKAGMVLAAFIVIKILVALALQLLATFALPILFGVVILAALFVVARFLTKNFGDKFQPIIDTIWRIFDYIKTLPSIISTALTSLSKYLLDGIGRFFGKIKEMVSGLNPLKKARDMIGFANGGKVNASGVYRVGERGEETVFMPKDAMVLNNNQTKKLHSNNTQSNTFNITINARDTSDAELRRIATQIGNMVNSKINRSVSSRTLG